ncbi:tetratricopeptide repeat protein [Photobacterium kasasachensis]|uniref:tetratricopeptide repeat protein n=1 Tax=Photobacterium kasasachensis TaxID=2910240 RepID=UPI003D09856D
MDDYKLEQAWRCYHYGQTDQAIELLKELLGNNPNDAFYHGLLSACLLKQKRLHAAEYELKIALSLDPESAFLLMTQANIQYCNNHFKQAIDSCDEALTLDPELVEALLLKSRLHFDMEKRELAQSCLQQALSLAPDSVSVLTALGEHYYNIGELQDSFEIASEALRVAPQDEDANVLMGNVQLALGDVDDATYHAKFAICQNPSSEEALKLFANIKMRKNWFLGLWWRINSKISGMSNIKSSMVLISGYLLFNLLATILSDLGYGDLSLITSYAWLSIVAYSWICLPLYNKQLEKELQQFSFNPDF